MVHAIKISLLCLSCLLCFQAEAQIKLQKVKKGYKYITYSGKKLHNTTFEDAKEFRGLESYAAVKVEDKWGFINRDIEMVIQPQFEDAQSFRYEETIVINDGKSFLINKSADVLSALYDSLAQYRYDYIAVENGKYGIINNKGKVLLKLEFESIGGKTDDGYIVKKNGQWGYSNEGEFTIAHSEIKFNRTDTPAILLDECLELKTQSERKTCSNQNMLTLVYGNMKYPSKARSKRIEGTAVIRFKINKEGLMEDPEIIRDLDEGCGEAALQVVKEQLGTWAKAAYLDGEPVETIYTLPVKFKLGD